ncbi:MAG TPA: adenylate/guanylate cyclase domain-containing protein [Ignavibacteriaceae bacterium]|nr:adenylate/guanylate cyclase domain-containing protein [Ignavibacteriaceae bacterium]
MLDEKVKILIAEDETIIAIDIKSTLQKIGYSVLEIATSGEKVIELLSVSKPDLILMDISLAGNLDGIETTEIISKKYDLPVVYLTALTNNETLERARVTEPFGYLLKPFDERNLHSTIEMALYKHKVDSELKKRTKELEDEKIKTDELLHNIFPSEIVKELKANGTVNPKQYDSVSILFTDFDNFTSFASKHTADKLVKELNHIFTSFDFIIDKYKLEKLKTIGDSYMIAGGLPNVTIDHAIKITQAAIEMQEVIGEVNEKNKFGCKMRIGIHTGPCVAGIVGIKKYTYDVWGDTVNIAKRLETNCEPGKINISEATYKLIKESFDCEYRGCIEAKGKGEIEMYFVKATKPAISNVI